MKKSRHQKSDRTVLSRAGAVAVIAALSLAPLSGGEGIAFAETVPDCGRLVGEVHEVSNASQLQAVGSGLMEAGADCRLDASYRQTETITLPPPVGELNPGQGNGPAYPRLDSDGFGQHFTGTYDGGGHSIIGFTSNDRSFFANQILEAEVKKLHLVDVKADNLSRKGVLANSIRLSRIENVTVSGTLTVGGSNTGGFANEIQGSELESVEAHLAVSHSTGGDAQGFGGIAAFLARNGVVQSVVVSARTTGQVVDGAVRNRSGGLFGEVDHESRILKSTSSMSIDGSGTLPGFGGLVGVLDDDATIQYSYATGAVAGPDGIGGFVGQAATGNVGVFDSYATGAIRVSRTTDGNSAGGGFVGRVVDPATRKPTIERSYSTGSVQGSDKARELDLGAWAGQRESNAADFGAYDNLSANFFQISDQVPSLGIARTGDSDEPEARAKVRGLTPSEATSFTTYFDAGWAIVDGWEPFKAPLDGSEVDQRTDKVWGICSPDSDNPEVNDGYPFLLWQFDSDPCVVSVGGVTGSSSSPERRSADAGIHLDLQASVGGLVAGSSVVIGGQGLAGGSQYSLVVRSTPQTLVSGTASSLGNFSGRASLPALPAGSHTLTLTATALDGSTLTLVQSFTVSADGTFSAIGSPMGSQSGGLAATGVNGLTGGMGLAGLALLLGVAMVASARRYQRTH